MVTAVGEPQNFGSLVGKGLIEAQGCIEVAVNSGADADVLFRISINGVVQEFIVSPRRNNRKYSFEIRLDNFKFGVRREGREPRPGVNVITARTSVLSGAVCNSCGVSLKLSRLRFNALAPFLLVHGRSAGPGWFSSDFRRPFDDRSIGYYTAKRKGNAIPKPDSLGDDVDLENIGRGPLASSLSQACEEFGADRVHVVAHSKGGLWSRSLFASFTPSQGCGAYSLTTLDTPHKGSVLADLSIAAQKGAKGLSIGETILLVIAGWTGIKADDSLRTESLSVFNSVQQGGGKNRLPEVYRNSSNSNRISYLSFSGDSDLDGDGRISQTEACAGGLLSTYCLGLTLSSSIPGTGVSITVGSLLYSLHRTYESAFQDSNGNLVTVRPSGDLSLFKNDFAVTLRSAEGGPKFTLLSREQATHDTIGDRLRATKVLQAITLQAQIASVQ